jgi:hypothetical protein
MTDSVPNYIYKLALAEDVISKGMVKLLEDFGVYSIDEEKALKLFYSIMAHIMYHLDIHPGQYFKLKFIDIVADKDNFICVKRNLDYTEDTVDPQMFYNRFCGTAVLKAELESSLDLFAKSFLGIKESKKKQRRNIESLIQQREKLSEEIQQCTDIIRGSKKQKQAVLKVRKEELKKIRAYAKKQDSRSFSSSMCLLHRDKFQQQYKELEQKLQELWSQNISLKEILDKTL